MGTADDATRQGRRHFLTAAAGTGAALAAGAVLGRPAAATGTSRAAGRGGLAVVDRARPVVTHGVQSGDVGSREAVVWARADRPGRMVVEVAPTESFRWPRQVEGPTVGAGTDFTGKVLLRNLPPGTEVHYRVSFTSEGRGAGGEPVAGRLRTAPLGRGAHFVWSGDTAGQGWGINVDDGGMRTYEAMRALGPDFFVHSGDTIYADGPLAESVTLPDGSVWRNLVTPEKSKVAETLDEYRGNHRYNLLDDNVRRFNAEVPIVAQWDDHEVTNNWWPGEVLTLPQYTVTDVDLLTTRARQAFHEYLPIRAVPGEEGRVYRRIAYGRSLELFVVDMRTYRAPNSPGRQPAPGPDTALLGERQLAWLRQSLADSRATWKVVCADMPLSLVVPDGATDIEAIAQGDDGPALGREHEVAGLLAHLRRRQVRNVVWVTADVHYTAAHHYDPARAVFQDFDPFWEFVSGPLNAATQVAANRNRLDATFGPEVVFEALGDPANPAPSSGRQFFGEARIDPHTEVLTVTLRDRAGAGLWSVDLPPEGGR
jgi:alkaline phosphatase D